MVKTVRGAPVPSLLYGTAWKEERTEDFVSAALDAGFRGIDTANQRKHYHEAGVGSGIAAALREGRIRRDELFVQTKFTFQDGQDHRLPYDPSASVHEQVLQSFESSLAHLGLDTIDSLILHGPSQDEGLGPDDREAWRAMEELAGAERVRLLGASNVTARQVAELVALAQVPVAFVQNRCYADRAWGRAVREVCAAHGIVYQAFSLLTANRHVLANPRVQAIAERHAATPAQIVLRFAQQVGMLPLTGTTDPAHMRQDLAIEGIELAPEELAALERGGR